jgi:hypothetical protein
MHHELAGRDHDYPDRVRPGRRFAVLNMVAWRRWTLQGWLALFGLATILIIGLNSILAF